MAFRFDRATVRRLVEQPRHPLVAAVMVASLMAIEGAGAQSLGVTPLGPNALRALGVYDYVGEGPGPHTLSCPKHKNSRIVLKPGEAKTSFKFTDPGGDDTCYCTPGNPLTFLEEWVFHLNDAASGATDAELPPRARRIRANASRYAKDVAANGIPMLGTRAFDIFQKFEFTGTLSPPPGGEDSYTEQCYTLGQLKTFAKSLLPLLRSAAAKAR